VIAVEQPVDTALVSGTSTVDFGTTAPGTARPLTFTIRNTGNAELSGVVVTRDGANASDFSVTSAPAPTVAAGASTTFIVAFNPSGSGLRTAVLHLASNDPARNPFNLNLSGTGNTAPTFAGYASATPYQTTASIILPKILAKATDAEGDALSVASAGPISARGGMVVLQADAILFIPAAGVSGVDTFPVTLTDARGAATTGTVTMTVGHSPTGGGITSNPPKLTLLTGGSVGLRFQGIPGQSYLIQRSPDMAVWTTLTTTTANADGTLTYTDESPPQPNGFYRLALP
jgi:hypothetical protein